MLSEDDLVDGKYAERLYIPASVYVDVMENPAAAEIPQAKENVWDIIRLKYSNHETVLAIIVLPTTSYTRPSE